MMIWHFLVAFFAPIEEEKGITAPPPALMMALHMVCAIVSQSVSTLDAYMPNTYVMVSLGGLCDGLMLWRAHTRPSNTLLPCLCSKNLQNLGTLLSILALASPAEISNDFCMIHTRIRIDITIYLYLI